MHYRYTLLILLLGLFGLASAQNAAGLSIVDQMGLNYTPSGFQIDEKEYVQRGFAFNGKRLWLLMIEDLKSIIMASYLFFKL